jgi:hypothetical protein
MKISEFITTTFFSELTFFSSLFSSSLCPSVPSISLIYTAVTVVSVHAFPSFQIAAAA